MVSAIPCAAPYPAAADSIIPSTDQARRDFGAALNGRRVGIVTGGPGGTYIRLGADLSNLVEDASGGAIRVIVSVGRGSIGNLQDLAFLRYTDLALVQSDVLASLAREQPADYAYLRDKLAFVAKFHPELVHVVVRGGPVAGPGALDGKRLAIDRPGSGTQITAPNIFGKILGVAPVFVAMRPAEALADLVSDQPSIDGMVYVTGRGSSLFKSVSADMARRIRDKGLYFVPFPKAPPPSSSYLGDRLSDADYPSFIDQGDEVPVWSVPAVLAVYDWDPHGNSMHRDRYRRVAEFVDTFFDNRARLDDGPGGFNDNWCAIDLAADVPGWKRFAAARSWLDRHRGEATAICADDTRQHCAASFAAAMRTAGLDPQDPKVAGLFETWKAEHAGDCR